MSYIGNSPDVNAFTIGVERFNGTGACTQFTLTRDIDDSKAIEIVVNGVQQDPDNSYTVTNGIITFSEAPPTGANNITVTYRSPIVITFNQVTESQLQANSVKEGAIAENAITTSKISPLSVTGNKLGLYSVSGNNIGTGAISANNFAGGGITSNVLSSNLQLSVSQITEKINISGSSSFYGGVAQGSVSGILNIDIMNATVHSFEANTTGNVTFNLRGNSINTFDSCIAVGNSVSLMIALKHNAAGGRAQTNVHIDGGLIQSGGGGWAGNLMLYNSNTAPSFSPITKDEYNFYSLTVFKRASNTYSVFLANTTYGRGSGF